MEITEDKRNNVCVIALKGRLDTETTQGFQDKVSARIDGGDTRIAVDMSALDYISSVGLRSFLFAAKKIKPLGGKLALAGMQPHIKEVFDIAGFTSLFPTFPSIDTAVQGLG